MTISITVSGENAAELVAQLTKIQAVLGGEPAPKATAPKETKAKDTPKVDPTPPTEPVSASTQEALKAEFAGNSQGLTAEAFSKLGLQFAKECGDNGAKLKDIWANYQQKDGTPVNRLGAVQEKDYDAMIADMEAAKLA